MKIQILWPEQKQIQENILNNNSIVCKLVYKNFSMLFTGDIEEVAEKQIIANYKNSKILDSTILKVAHHGSRYSTQMEFLERTKPEISMISCGEKNFYGHPHEELLDRLEQMTSDIYVTKDYGAIWITTDGEKIDLHTFCKYNKS